MHVTSPPDMMLGVVVYRTSGPSHRFTPSAKGESVSMDLTLPAGEYLVMLRSNDYGSRSPYKLRLDLQDPFAPAPDREPNNDHADASAIPADLVLRGKVGEYSDADWYQLPELSRETTMRVQVLSMSAGLTPGGSISIINRAKNGNEYLNWAKRDSVWEMKIPANAPDFVQLHGRGDYQLRLSFSPGIPVPPGRAPFTRSEEHTTE